MSHDAGRTSSPAGPEIGPRTRPIQKRAIRTVDRILDAAVDLLDEVGVDAFNTNLIAERAGVAVRSVYRYYPNKLAVIVALYERSERRWEPYLQKALRAIADPRQSALKAWESCIDDYVAYLDGGGWSLWQSMQALPEIREVAWRYDEIQARQIATALRTRGARGDDRRLEAVAYLLIESMCDTVENAWMRYRRVPRAIASELKLMHWSYLANYVD